MKKLFPDDWSEGLGTAYPSEADLDDLDGLDEGEIREATIQLKKMSALNETLRKFLAKEFRIESIAAQQSLAADGAIACFSSILCRSV